MKKKTKIILIIVLVILLASAVFALTSGAELQMQRMAKRTMEHVQEYDFASVLGKDPVHEKLETVFEDKPESVEAIYKILKDNAAGMEWQVISVDKDKASADVSIQYSRLDSFVQAYAEGLAEALVSRIEAGELTFNEADTILSALSDEESVALIQAAAEKAEPESEETTAQIFFGKKGLLYVPKSGSDELYNAASGGLYTTASTVADTVAKNAIVKIMDRIFDALKNYDIDTLEQLTGADLSMLRNLRESSALGAAVADFMADCAGTITYEVTDFNADEMSATVAFDYPDASGIIKPFAENLVQYGLKHLFSGKIMSDEISAEVFCETVNEQGELPRLQQTVTFAVDEENGEISLPDTVYDIVTGNLYSRLQELIGLLEKYSK